MRGLLCRLCRYQPSPPQVRHSPLTGARSQPLSLGDNMEEGSHVRFQDSDLDALDLSERNNNEKQPTEEDMEENLEERVYSEVSEEPPKAAKRVHYKEDSEQAPRPAVRRRKRRERDNSRRERLEERGGERSEEDGMDWLPRGPKGDSRETEVLRTMVHKLSLQLGKEQGRRRETGAQLEEVNDPAWLTQLGGLVPLLVAYEEELEQVGRLQIENSR